MSARLRLTLSYAGFLLLAGAATLLGVYLVLRYVPDYPLTAANPRDQASPVASRQEILDAIVEASGFILAALAVLGLGGGWLLAGWVLRPLRDLTEAAQLAAQGRLDHRVGLGRRDEFGRLADTFDDMLGRLDDAFAAQERFAANAAHELRTPLAVSATLLDVARAEPTSPEQAQLIERLRATNARAVALTDALLRLADANAVRAAAEPVDLAVIAAEAVDEARDEATERGVAMTASFDPAPVTGDAPLLGQLAANLVQNALRHNGGADAFAHVTTGQDDGRAWLRVVNSGPEVTREQATQLTEPFLRGAGRTAGAGGHGLGLALVARIVDVHGGTLTIAPREGGGLVVEVGLPPRGAQLASRHARRDPRAAA